MNEPTTTLTTTTEQLSELVLTKTNMQDIETAGAASATKAKKTNWGKTLYSVIRRWHPRWRYLAIPFLILSFLLIAFLQMGQVLLFPAIFTPSFTSSGVSLRDNRSLALSAAALSMSCFTFC